MALMLFRLAILGRIVIRTISNVLQQQADAISCFLALAMVFVKTKKLSVKEKQSINFFPFKKISLLFSIVFSVSLKACQSSVKKGNETTDIKIIPEILYIDRVKIGDSIRAQFLIKNIGKRKLKIKNVAPACECSIANFDTSFIDIGKETVIDIVYRNNADTGKISKIFILDANTKEGLTPLYLKTKNEQK